MKKSATKSVIADAAKELGITTSSFMDMIGPELKVELERSENERKKYSKWFDDGIRANAHNEEAMKVLLEALQSAANHPNMTPEVKEIADTLIILIEDKTPFKYDFDTVLEPVIEIVEKGAQSNSGKHAANVRHAENRERREIIREIWESGKYSNRNICADEEWAGLGFNSKSTARHALENTPDPTHWPANETKK